MMPLYRNLLKLVSKSFLETQGGEPPQLGGVCCLPIARCVVCPRERRGAKQDRAGERREQQQRGDSPADPTSTVLSN